MAISITDTGVVVSNGMSILVERSREPLVALGSLEVSIMTDGAS